MSHLFAVVREHGPAWNDSLPLEGQPVWQAHAAFMDALATQEFVLLGGPLEGTPRVLLIIQAKDEEEIRNRLAEDPWTQSNQLCLTELWPWSLRLGKLQ